jgi:hypothetical protein
MDLITGELRNQLDPTAIRILKKRLVSGKITPQVFKDILKRQMVKYFFQTYRHPLIESWDNLRKSPLKQLRDTRNTKPKTDQFEILEHKRF